MAAFELFLSNFAELAACKALASSPKGLPTHIIAALCVHTW